MHRWAHLRHRHRRDHRDSHRHRDDRRHRGRHEPHRGRHERHRVHLDHWAGPNERASHRGWGEEACCRDWDEDRPGRGRDDRRLRFRRGLDAVRHRGEGHRYRVQAETPDARRELPSNRDCYRPWACGDLAWGLDLPRVPDESPEPVSPRPRGLAGQPVQAPWVRVLPASVLPDGPLPGVRPELPVRPGPVRRVPASGRRAWRPSKVPPELLRWTVQQGSPRAVRHPVSLMMVFLPGLRHRSGLRRLRRERPSLGRTDEVDGPRGPRRSTTRI